jgi:lipoprotein signal peptidase
MYLVGIAFSAISTNANFFYIIRIIFLNLEKRD